MRSGNAAPPKIQKVHYIDSQRMVSENTQLRD